MREIEFRGKALEDDEFFNIKKDSWIYGNCSYDKLQDNYHIEDTTEEDIKMIKVDPITIGQFTGFRDKDDTKIFDGDIIYFKDENMYGLINFRYGGWYITWYGYVQVCNGVSWEEEYAECNEESLYSNCLTEEDKIPYKIVGNIYDNPELLGGDNG